MGVRNTEKRIPEGFDPKDLGQSVIKTTDNYDLALISYLTESIPVGSTIDYVAFLLRYPPGVDEALRYAWNFRMDNDDGTKDDSGTLQTIFGINSYIPKKTGKLTVTVSIGRDSTTEMALIMQQKIVRNNASEYLNSIYGNLLNPSINTDISDSNTCENINPSAFTEVINELEQYIHLSAISPSSHSIPARFLAAIAYKGASDFPKEINSQNIWKVSRQRDILRAQDLLNRPSVVNITDKDLKLGVCQVKPERLKAVLEEGPWNNNAMSEDDKQIDLFNLLRFPKTNILMCAWILNSYNSYNYSLDWTFETLDSNNNPLLNADVTSIKTTMTTETGICSIKPTTIGTNIYVSSLLNNQKSWRPLNSYRYEQISQDAVFPLYDPMNNSPVVIATYNTKSFVYNFASSRGLPISLQNFSFSYEQSMLSDSEQCKDKQLFFQSQFITKSRDGGK